MPFAFSHHGTDPASGKLCNAFDLVRIHKFGDLDEAVDSSTVAVKLPSYAAMMDFSRADEAVKLTLGVERLNTAKEDFNIIEDTEEIDTEWLKLLEVNNKGYYKPSIGNLLLILENDLSLKGKIALNEFSHRTMIRGNLPWHKLRNKVEGDDWKDSDDAALRHYFEKAYDITAPNKIYDAVLIVEEKNKYHPIREYLNALIWDGASRVDTLLIDYLGTEDSPYNRAVTRKAMVAAVARVFVPGIKFDYMLVLVGSQGIGKSHIVNLLGQSWYSDSLSTVQGKEAYGKRVTKFPRQCVFFGTTNDKESLRDKTGNRRFWPVVVGTFKRKKNLWVDMVQAEIDQIWAEAVELWNSGESLKLEADIEKEAVKRQEQHTEESTKEGLVREYLDQLLPENWVELFRGDIKQMTHMQAREINDILRKMEGWETYSKGTGKLRFGKNYGLQRAFVRLNSS